MIVKDTCVVVQVAVPVIATSVRENDCNLAVLTNLVFTYGPSDLDAVTPDLANYRGVFKR